MSEKGSHLRLVQDEAIELFRRDMSVWLAPAQELLIGKNLVCCCGLCDRHSAIGKPLTEHCPDCKPCHVDIIGESLYGGRSKP